MKHKFKLFVIFLLVSAFAKAKNPVKTMPDFAFFRLDKTQFSKASIAQARKTFFVFFDSDCEHCRHAAQSLQQHCKVLENASIYLVTLYDSRKIKNFVGKNCPALLNKPNVTILHDLNNEFISRFNPRRYLSILLYSSGGKLPVYQDNETKMDAIFNACKNAPYQVL